MDKRQRAKLRKRRRMWKRIRGIVIVTAFVLLMIFATKGLITLIKSADGSPDVTPTPQATHNKDDNSSYVLPARPIMGEYTTLVNRQNPLTEDFEVETRKIKYYGKTVDKYFDVRVADRLEAMLEAAADRGYPLFVVSTYRTIEYQKGLYNRKVKEYLNLGYTQAAAKEEAGKWVAIPGTSEHNLGLVADIVSATWYNSNSDLTQEFENTGHFKWLMENCADYGFILRYPKDKESITGIVYEPWHYRYVGEEVAQFIMDNNLTLEEFWEE